MVEATVLALIAVPALVYLAYRPALKGPFLYDDRPSIQNSPLGQGDIRDSVRHVRWFSTLTIAVQTRIWGRPSGDPHQKFRQPSAFALHVGNAAIHAANSVLFYALLAAIQPILDWPDELPIWGMLAFALHPLAVNATAFISGRYSQLSVTWALATLLVIVHGFWWLAPIGWWLAFASKEDMIVLPATSWLTAFVLGRDPWPLLATVVLAAALAWTHPRIRGVCYNNARQGRDYASDLENAGYRFAPFPVYSQAFWTESILHGVQWFAGLRLSPMHLWPEPSQRRTVLAGSLVVVGVVAGSAVDLPSPMALAVIWVIASPWPMYGFWRFPQHFEQRAYGSMPGIALAWACALAALPAFVSLGLLYIAFWRTHAYAAAWSHPLRLWTWTCRVTGRWPQSLMGLVDATMSMGYDQRTKNLLREVIVKGPTTGTAWGNLSILADKKGDTAAAILASRIGVGHCPAHASLWAVLARQYQKTDRDARAMACFRRSTRLRPKMHEAWNELGSLYLGHNQPERARQHFEQAATRAPHILTYWNNLGIAARIAGKDEQAKDAFSRIPASMVMHDMRVESRVKTPEPFAIQVPHGWSPVYPDHACHAILIASLSRIPPGILTDEDRAIVAKPNFESKTENLRRRHLLEVELKCNLIQNCPPSTLWLQVAEWRESILAEDLVIFPDRYWRRPASYHHAAKRNGSGSIPPYPLVFWGHTIGRPMTVLDGNRRLTSPNARMPKPWPAIVGISPDPCIWHMEDWHFEGVTPAGMSEEISKPEKESA